MMTAISPKIVCCRCLRELEFGGASGSGKDVSLADVASLLGWDSMGREWICAECSKTNSPGFNPDYVGSNLIDRWGRPCRSIAQAIEARSGQTEGLDPKGESAVLAEDAPQ